MSFCKPTSCFAFLALLVLVSQAGAAPTLGLSAGPASAPLCSPGPRVITTELDGVPAVLSVPARPQKPPILLWHGFGPPADEQALMRAVPLEDVPAVKVYLGLPLFGKRAPPGGTEELVRRQQRDVGLEVFEPIVVGAAEELPRVVRELARQGCLKASDPIGLLGFSAGGAATLLALAEHHVRIGAAIVLNPSTGLTASVRAYEHATHQKYAWTAQSRAPAARSDATAHARDIAAGAPPPALLLLEGGQDDLMAHEDLAKLQSALAPLYAQAHQSGRLRHLTVQGLQHNIAGPVDDELAGQISAWYERYL